MSSFSNVAKLAVDPRYRHYLITLMLSGTAQSASMPIVSFYLIRSLGVSESKVGLFWMSIVVGSIISLSVGHLSDRLFVDASYVRYAAFWLALGWITFSYVRNFLEALLVFAFSLSTTSVLNSQVFAALGGVMTASGEERRSFVVSTLRTGYSIGYIIGPATAAVLVNTVGFRAVFFLTASVFLMIAITSGSIRRSHPAASQAPKEVGADSTGSHSAIVVVIFCGCVCLGLIGDFIKVSYLSLYVVNVLKEPLAFYSVVIAVGAALELFIFPIAGVLADRYGAGPVIAVGLFLAIVDYGILALSPHVWSVCVSQVLHVGVVAILYGVCAAYAQRLMGGRVGIATALYFVAISMAQASGGGIAALFAGRLGVQALFWVPSIAAAVGLIIFVILRQSLSRQENLRK